MRKLISIFLTVTLLLSTFYSSSVLGSATANSDSEQSTELYTDLNSWSLHSPSSDSATINENKTLDFGTWEKITINEDTAYTHEGRGKSVHIAANLKGVSLQFANLKQNTDYILSFWYYLPEGVGMSSSNTWLVNPGIYPEGAVVSDTGISNAIVTGSNTSATAANSTWHRYKIQFNSGTYQKLFFATRLLFKTKCEIYFDDFELSEVEYPENWGLYASTAAITGDNGPTKGWESVMVSTNQSYVYGSGTDSIVINANTSTAALKLSGLTENTDYTFSFKYYVPNGTQLPNLNSWITNPGIYKSGAVVSSTSYTNAVARGSNVAGAAGEWHDFSVDFNSGDNTELYFAGYFAFKTNHIIYLDEIALTEFESCGWVTYMQDSEKIGTGGTLALSSRVSLTSDDDKDGDNQTFRLEANNYCQYPTYKLENLKTDTYYHLTFYYKAAKEAALDSAGGMFSHMYVLRDGGENVERSATHLGGITRNGEYYYNKYNTLILLDGSINDDISKTDWNKATIKFYSADAKSALLAMRLTYNAPVYVDDIELNEVEAFENSDLQNPQGWNTYAENSPKLGEGGTLSGGTIKMYYETDWQEFLGNERYILNPNNYCQWVTKELKGLKANTYYKLTMSYQSGSTSIDGSILSSVRVVKNGGDNLDYSVDNLGAVTTSSSLYTNQHDLIVMLEDNGTALRKPGSTGWVKLEIYFYSADQTSALLAMRPVATTKPTSSNPSAGAAEVRVEIGDIKKVNTPFKLADQQPNSGWGGKKDSYEIDFDREDFYVHLLANENRLKIEEAPQRNGVSTNALHILPGQFNTATCLNFASVTPNPGKDPVFTMQVEGNTKYAFSYWMYLEEDQEPLNSFLFYYDYCNPGQGNTYITHTGWDEKGKWVKFQHFFFTEPGQTECSIMFNAQTTPRDMWIDDIVLRKIGAGTVDSEPDKSYSETPYNMLSGSVLEDVSAAKSGVYKFKITKNVYYVFGATAGSDEISSSRVFVSFDGINPVAQNGATAPSPIIEANGKIERYGINFDSGDNEYVYLVIQNDDGKLKIEDPYLFLAYYTTTSTHKGYATDPNVKFETHKGSLGSFDSNASASKQLHVNNNSYLNENFLGVNFVHQLYGRMPDDLGRTYNDWMIENEKETMQKMRVKMIRSFYGSSLSWDAKTGKHNFESEWMQAFYQSCLDMQDIDVEVGITPQWQLTNLIDGKRPLTNQGVDISSMGYIAYDETGKVDLDKTYSNFAEFVKDSVLAFEARGIHNVKQMFCFTEVNNTMQNYTTGSTTLEDRNYDALYPIFDGMISAVDKGLKDASLRKQYQIIAPCDNWRADDGSETYSRLVRYTVQNLWDKVDVIGSHNGYDRAEDYSQDSFYNIPIEKLSSTMNDAQTAGKQYWIDEYNVLVDDNTAMAIKESNKNPYRGTAFGSMVNSIMNMGGVNNMYIWTLYDQQWPNSSSSIGEYLSGVQICGTLPCLNESTTPTPSWYAQSLITRYVGQGKTFECSNDTSIYCSAIERDDGEFTILVTNYNNEITPFDLTFEKSLEGKTLYRYVYNPNTIKAAPGNKMIAADAKEENITTGFSDSSPAMSVAIYTTERPEIESGLKTSYNNTAAIRTAGSTEGSVDKNGLRTYNQITVEYLEEREIVEYGAIVIRQGYLKSKFGQNTDPEFTTNTIDGTNRTLRDLIVSRGGVGLGVAYRAKGANTITSTISGHEGAKEILWQSSTSAKVFTTYITGISAANYDDEYLVRSYAIDNEGNIYYGDTSSISIFKVANAIDNAYNGEGSLGQYELKDIAAFKEFVGANPDNYVRWCGRAGVGKLYSQAISGRDVENELGVEK